MINNPKSLENEYIIIKLLGEGAFGKVYKVEKKSNKKQYALKIESKDSNTKLLKNEINIYRYLSSIKEVSNLYWYGVNSGLRYGVFDLYENDLQNIIIKKDNIQDICLQMLVIIKKIHEKKIIHRDLKPDNFMIKNNQIYIIDFGLSRSYINNNKHIEKKMKNNITGNIVYCSPFVQKKIESSRRDDLISLGYCFIYLLKKSLPWNKNTIKQKLTYDSARLYMFCKYKFIFYYFKYCFSLSFHEEPDYDKLLNLFNLYPIIT